MFAGEQLLFASGVHSRLCSLPQITGSTGMHVLHVQVLKLLASHMPCLPLRTSQERTFAVEAAVELVKSLERARQEANSLTESRLSPGEILRCLQGNSQHSILVIHVLRIINSKKVEPASYTTCAGALLSQQIMRGVMGLCFDLKSQGSPSQALERLLRDYYKTHSMHCTDTLVLEVALLVHNHASPAEGSLRDLVRQLLSIPDQPNLALKTGMSLDMNCM